jgi:hypothetical protein
LGIAKFRDCRLRTAAGPIFPPLSRRAATLDDLDLIDRRLFDRPFMETLAVTSADGRP